MEHTPKPLPTGYNGIPFIVGQGDSLQFYENRGIPSTVEFQGSPRRCEDNSICIWLFPKIMGKPPKSSILIGVSILNYLFWGVKHPYFWVDTHIETYTEVYTTPHPFSTTPSRSPVSLPADPGILISDWADP